MTYTYEIWSVRGVSVGLPIGYFNWDIYSKIFDVNPINTDSFEIETNKIDKEEFFRDKLSGGIVFAGDDYTNIKSVRDDSFLRDVPLVFVIKDSDGNIEFKGFMNPKAGDWNEDQCRVELETVVFDEYSVVYHVMNIERSIIDTESSTIYSERGGNRYDEFTDPVAGFTTSPIPTPTMILIADRRWTLHQVIFEFDFEDAGINYYRRTNIYRRDYSNTEILTGNWIVDPDDSSRWINYYRLYTPGSGVSFSETSNNGQTIVYESNLSPTGEILTYDRARRFNTIMEDFAPSGGGISYGFTSDILYNNTSPISVDTPSLIGLYMLQKSDAKQRSDPATNKVGITTLRGLLDYLRDIFQIYWHVQRMPSGTYNIRVEHIKYYEGGKDYNGFPSVAEDVTSISPSSIVKTNKYRYVEEDTILREKFKWSEVGTEDFFGRDIEYFGTLERTDEKEYVPAGLTTDLPLVQNSPENVSNDGFVLVNVDLSTLEVIKANGVITGEEMVNGDLAWANLHHYFWIYNRPLPKGILNENEVDFESYKRLLEQQITYPSSSGFDPFKLTRTNLGDGAIEKTSIKLNSCSRTSVLRYYDI